jgi:hypothetical protein
MFFDAILGAAQDTLESYKNKRRRPKIKIVAANTARAYRQVFTTRTPKLDETEKARLYDYLDELRQQAKWDAEKCGNQ